MKTYLRPAGAVLLAVSMATAAYAQFTGPGAQQPPAKTVLGTVAEVLGKPVDDQHVRLTGTLVRQTGRETFLFRDATGEIQVEIDREDFPAGEPVGAETVVVIEGEVDTRFMKKPEIDVEVLRVNSATPAAR
jgi:uncharacterized protein (TIGR00156 family)